MVGPDLSFFYQQLLYQSPALLAAVAGIVYSLFALRRVGTPAVLCLLGCGLLLLVPVATAFAQYVLFQANNAPMRQNLMNTVALVGSLFRAAGLGLVVAAVFVGRRRFEPIYDD